MRQTTTAPHRRDVGHLGGWRRRKRRIKHASWAYYCTQLTLTLRNKKNILAGLIMIAAALAFVSHFNRALLPPEQVHLSTVRNEARSLQAEFDATRTLTYQARQALQADQTIQAGVATHSATTLSAGLIRRLRVQDSQWIARLDYSYPPVYYSDRSLNADPRWDGHYGNQRMVARLRDYTARTVDPVDLTLYNEQTFLQTLVRVSAKWLPWVLMTLSAVLACDMVTEDWRHRSVTSTLPISIRRQLLLKNFAGLTPVVVGLVLFVALVAATTVPRYGVGLGAGVAQFLSSSTEGIKFRVVPQAGYLLAWLGLLGLLCWVIMRLTLVLQLLMRNEYAALIITLIILISPLTYYVRNGGAFQAFPLALLLPTSYSAIGNVLSGYQRFYFGSELMTGGMAALVLVGWSLVLEGLLWALSRRDQVRGAGR